MIGRFKYRVTAVVNNPSLAIHEISRLNALLLKLPVKETCSAICQQLKLCYLPSIYIIRFRGNEAIEEGFFIKNQHGKGYESEAHVRMTNGPDLFAHRRSVPAADVLAPCSLPLVLPCASPRGESSDTRYDSKLSTASSPGKILPLCLTKHDAMKTHGGVEV
jgi:hypothetical protein